MGLLTSLKLCSVAPGQLAAIVRPCLPQLDFLIVNDVEIGAVGGVATLRDGATDIAACRAAVRAVAAQGSMRLVAAHFPRGAVAVTGDGRGIEQPSLRVPPAEIAAANGAGDAFAAGTLYGMHQGWTAENALALGRAAAAASLRGMSTTGAVPTWQECLTLAHRWGVREPWDAGDR